MEPHFVESVESHNNGITAMSYLAAGSASVKPDADNATATTVNRNSMIISFLLFGIRLTRRVRKLKGGQITARRHNCGQTRVRCQLTLEALGVEPLRHQTDIGKRQLFPEAVRTLRDRKSVV